MGIIAQHLQDLHHKIEAYEQQYQRDPRTVKLLCVSKTKPEALIIEAYQAGERLFGESYAHEAEAKINSLKAQGFNDICWHFIGPIQSNKTKIIAACFDLVESVDREKIAKRLNDQRPDNLPPLDVLIQVNISDEAQKSGCNYAGLPQLAKTISSLPRLKLRGLMGVAKDTDNQAEIEASFVKLKQCFEQMSTQYADFDLLSIGMTHDMGLAIKSGSTELRIGTAIFGPREYKHKEA